MYCFFSGTFALPHLEILDLSENKIDTLRKQSFHGLESLQRLDLSGNEIVQLSTEQFRNLKCLRILNLSRNKIRSLPRDVFEGTRLEILDLSHNKFIAVPSASFLEVGYTLRDLNMAENFLDHLDSTSFPTSQLVSLNLAQNRLTILPDNSFVSLGKLLSLNVSQNVLQANFKELFHYLPDLRQLHLANCGLRSIPLLPLTNLNILDLSFNNIDETSNKQFQYLEALKIFLLVNNSLTSMPSVRLNILRELDVSGNPIEVRLKLKVTNKVRPRKERIGSVNHVFYVFTGAYKGELSELSEIRKIKREEFESNQISGQGLFSALEISKVFANTNVAAGRRISSASFAVRLTASDGRNTSDGAFAEASDTKRLYETTERANDHRKRS